MCKKLGASITETPSQIQPFFPFQGERIHVVYDPSHIIKLVRNIFGRDKYSIFDGDGNKIEWKYDKNLYIENYMSAPLRTKNRWLCCVSLL